MGFSHRSILENSLKNKKATVRNSTAASLKLREEDHLSERKSLHALLGHLSPLRGPLTCLEPRVGLIDHVESAPTLDDLAISVTTLGGTERGQNFHWI